MDEVKDCSKSIQIAIIDKLIKTKDDTNIIQKWKCLINIIKLKIYIKQWN